MAVSATASNHIKTALAKGQIDLSADDIKIILMRSGFVFNKDTHAQRKNVKGTITAITLAIDSAKALVDSGNGLVTAGFVPGNVVTLAGFTEGGNTATKTISTVAAGKIEFTNTTGLVEEIAGDSVTVTCIDELVSAFDYTQDTYVLTTPLVTENDTDDRMDFTCDDAEWTANGGSIGPTPGAILYDDTDTEKSIIGYLNFDGEKTAVDTAVFSIEGIKIQVA